MDTVNYVYNGKLWKTSSTVPDKNSFFHATFGLTANSNEPYLDKRVKYRRSRWATFLNYFDDETMPPRFAETMKKCLSANKKHKHVSVEDQDHFEDYVLDVMKAEHDVTLEEIPVLAALENVNIVLFKSGESEPAIIIQPDSEILGSYLNTEEHKGEIVLHMEGTIFSRMNPVIEDLVPKFTECRSKIADVVGDSADLSSSVLIRYQKGGSAGSEGVEYQVGLITVFFLNAFQKLRNWQLSTENKAAGKFDDVVLEWPEGATLLQAKHKQSKTKKINFEELFSTNSKNDDFSIPKYFLSYEKIKKTFKLKEVILCTNASVDKKVMKFLKVHPVKSHSMLYYEKCDCKFYTFSDEILPHLKENVKNYYEKNFQNKEVDESTITDENIKDFIGHLQLFFNYPPNNDVKSVAEQLLSHMKLSENLYVDVLPLDIYTKLLDWFRQKDGVYLTELYAKVIFSEIWRDKHCQNLDKYKIFFQCNDLRLQNSERVFHFTAEGERLLQEMKIFQTLQSNKMKFLFVNVHDGTEKQKQVIEAFGMPQYTILVLVWPNLTQEFITKEASYKLREILDKFEYKKVVLLADRTNKIPQLIGLRYDVITESITFTDLVEDSQKRLLNKENIIFQGNLISLNELFARQATEYAKLLNTENLEKLVRDEKVKVGASLSELDEHIMWFYIKRNLKRRIGNSKDEMPKSSRRKEIVSEEMICEMNEKVVLISDSAGTGKSTVLANLALTMKKKYSHLWVIRIDLNNYTQILKVFLGKNRETINILELLDSKRSTKLTNQLERVVFSMKEKVVLMLDGFDEISPDYTQLVLNLLSYSQEQQNFAKVVVTTRPHMARRLEEKLQVVPFLLTLFTEQNQIDFLTSYWMHNLDVNSTEKSKCEEYAKILIEKMSTWVRLFEHGTNHFAAIPLHVRMLADIFQENNQLEIMDDWKGCKEYLATSGVEIKFPENINVTKLYKMFVEKKRSVFIDKGNPSGNTAVNPALIEQFEACLAYHRNLALELILDKRQCELFSCRKIIRNLEMSVLKIGIVQKLDNEFHFAHRTFAEYFFAESLIEELQVQNENAKFQKFLIEKILLRSQSIIHVFFNNFLQQIMQALSPNTLYKYRFVSYQMTSFDKTKFHLLNDIVRNGHLEILQLILQCMDLPIPEDPIQFFVTPVGESIPKYSNILNIVQHELLNFEYLYETLLEHAAAGGHLEMVKFLVEQGANVNIGQHKPLYMAVSNGHSEVAKFLVERGANVRAKHWESGTTVLYKAVLKNDTAVAKHMLDIILRTDGLTITDFIIPYMAAYLGRLDILEKLIERGLDINCTVENDETFIFGAVRGGQLETIKYLMQQGCDIHSRDHECNTVLHVISKEPSLMSTAKLLITDLDIDVNAKNVYFTTALHIAVNSNNFNLVKLFMEHGANVNSADRLDLTALHIAVEEINLDLVKLLVNGGANVNSMDENGVTALHIAVKQPSFDLVELLLNLDANVNLANQEGVTALHIAVKENYFDLVELLLNHGANVNFADQEGETALHIAVKENHFDLIELLVNRGANVNLADEEGATVLHIAAEESTLNVVELFLNHDANLNLINQEGVTALYIAVNENNFDLAELLVSHGADVNFSDEEGMTALHLAVDHNSSDLVELLINHGANVNLADQKGITALHMAARENHFNLVELLVNHGANVNMAKQTGATALHIAVKEGNFDLAVLLLNHGAHVNLAKKNGITALHIAVKIYDFEIVELLVNRGANVNLEDQKGTTALHIALGDNSFDLVKLLVNSGANVNLTSQKGVTALHIAVQENGFDFIELLVSRGANVNLANQKGQTALHIAIEEHNFSLAELLVNRGANVNLADQEGMIALHIATEENQFDLVQLLVSCGADMNLDNVKGNTALHITAVTNQMHIMKFLVGHGVNINSKNKCGFTALHLATEQCSTQLHKQSVKNLDFIKFLIESGTDVNIRNSYGSTVLHLAARMGQLEIIILLVEFEVDVNITDNEGRTALHLAAFQGHTHIVKLLIQHGANSNIRDNNGHTVLHYLVNFNSKENRCDVLRLVIKNCKDVNHKTNGGCTALHLAISGGDLDTIILLVESGVDVNIRNGEGRTGLHLAVREGHFNIIKYLLSRCVNVTVRDNTGYTALHFAAGRHKSEDLLMLRRNDTSVSNCSTRHFAIHERGADIGTKNIDDEMNQNFVDLEAREKVYLDIVETIVTKCSAAIDIEEGTGCTALYLATLEGHLEISTLLVQHGADVNIQNVDGRTALHAAADEGHVEIVKFLLNWGVDIDIRDNQGATPLHIAAEKNAFDVVVLLVEFGMDVDARDGTSSTALHKAICKNHFSTAKYLVETAVDITIKNDDGYTALHLAVLEDYLEVAQVLVKHNADINIKDNSGRSALQLAVDNGKLDIAKLLVECDTGINHHYGNIDWVINSNNHRTVLHLAAERGELDSVVFFAKLGIDVNITDDEGYTALQLALNGGHLSIVKYLVNMGADVTGRKNYESLVLHLAAKSGDLDSMAFFVQRCTDVSVTDKAGNTALHSAVRQKSLDIVEFLVNSGIDVNVKNNNGRTALHLASKRSCLDIAKFLVEHGADLNDTDNRGFTALHLAACCSLDLVIFLVERGADVYLKIYNGYTAAMVAQNKGCTDVFKYLKRQASLRNILFC